MKIRSLAALIRSKLIRYDLIRDSLWSCSPLKFQRATDMRDSPRAMP